MNASHGGRIRLGDTSDPYQRSEEGWTLFTSRRDGFFWFDAENLGASFHCTVEFMSIDCEMTSGPPAQASSFVEGGEED